MKKQEQAASYARKLDRLYCPGDLSHHEQKFAGFLRALEESRPQTQDGVRNLVIAFPQILGDTYEEIIESLSRVAAAGMSLHVVGTQASHCEQVFGSRRKGNSSDESSA